MSELDHSLSFALLLDRNRDDTPKSIRIMEAGLQLEQPILDYFGKDSPAELDTDEIDRVGGTCAAVLWACRRSDTSITTAQVGRWFEATDEGGEWSPMGRLLVQAGLPRIGTGNILNVVMLDYTMHINGSPSEVMPERLEY